MRLGNAIGLLALLAAFHGARAQDAGELLRLGNEARRAGNFELAADHMREAARLRPDDADVQVGLGLALTPLKRFDEAERAFRYAVELAPDYLDARIGLARIALYGGRFAEAQSAVRKVLEMRADYEDARELAMQIDRAISDAAKSLRLEQQRAKARRETTVRRAPIKPEPEPDAAVQGHRWRVDADGGWSRLTGGRQDWLEASGRLSYSVFPGTNLSAAIEAARRNGLIDTYLEGRVDHRVAPDIFGYILFGATPNANFFPQYRLGGGTAIRLFQRKGVIAATVLTLDAKYSEYVVGPVRNVTPGIEQYFFDGRLWLSAKWINTVAETGAYLQGYLVRADLILRDDLRLFFGYADAPETSEGRTVETRSIFGGVIYEINPITTLRLSAAFERRPNLFDRTLLSIGVSRKF
jgi:YaiO family outer membrane protein